MSQTANSGPVAAPRQRGSVMVWLVGLIVLVGAAVIGALIGYFIFTRVNIILPLHNQPATVTLPSPFVARGTVLDTLDIRIDETIHTTVPVHQRVTIPVEDTLKLMLHFDGDVPLKLTIPVHETIPLKQVVHLDTEIEATILGSHQTLDVRGDIPLDEKITLDLMVPVEKTIHLTFTAPVVAKIDQKLTVPLNTTIEADVPIDSSFNVPVLNQIKARLNFPDVPTRVVISEARLVLPLRTLQLGLVDDAGENGSSGPTNAEASP